MIKTVSLETAKTLKEAGFRQDTHFCWFTDCSKCFQGLNDMNPLYHTHLQPVFENLNMENAPCAPTSDELLKELPRDTEICKRMSDYYIVNCEVDSKGSTWLHVRKDNESLPEALADMWLYLKKEGLLT